MKLLGPGKLWIENSVRFQYADDLRHDRLIVENMFEDLVAKTEVERAILERQSIVGGISQLQPLGDFWGRFIYDKPVFVEITAPIFEHVNAEGIVTLRKQGAHGRTDAATEVENCRTAKKAGVRVAR